MKIYKQIENCVENKQSLLPVLNQLHEKWAPSRTLRTKSLSEQQILSQIYQHLKNPFEKLKNLIDNTWE